jgi:hypothetical protein
LRNTSRLSAQSGMGSRELAHTSIMHARHGVMRLRRGDAHRHGLGSCTEFGSSSASSRYYRRPNQPRRVDSTYKAVPVPRHPVQSTGNPVPATAGSQGATRGQPIGDLLLVLSLLPTLQLRHSACRPALCRRSFAKEGRAASCSRSRGNKKARTET